MTTVINQLLDQQSISNKLSQEVETEETTKREIPLKNMFYFFGIG
jgi:hypothetical protein